MKSSSINKITDIIDEVVLQNIQNFFAKTMDVSLITVASQKMLTEPSNTTSFCDIIIGKSEKGLELCSDCRAKIERETMVKRKPVICKCHSGLVLFAIPLVLDDRPLTTLIGGQISTENFDATKIKQLARKLDLNAEELLNEWGSIRVMSLDTVEILVDSLSRITNSILSVAYAHSNLSNNGLKYRFSKNMPIEEWVFLNCKTIKKPLSEREFAVLKLIVLGKSNSEIANELFISVHTAKAHVSAILEKFGVDDRVQIAVKAVREGLI